MNNNILLFKKKNIFAEKNLTLRCRERDLDLRGRGGIDFLNEIVHNWVKGGGGVSIIPR